MPDPQDIESKLTAYVDGVAEPGVRAEIESYLSKNPQQRRLIADLMRQRDVLRDLPKEPAPGEIAEAINAQLERAVLLGDIDHESGSAHRITPWRHFAGVAAILLLAGGLGLTIYMLLPSPTHQPMQLSNLPMPTSLPSEAPMSEAAVEPLPAPVPATAPMAAAPATEQEERLMSALHGGSAVENATPDRSMQAAMFRNESAVPAIAGNDPMTITIETSQPKQTRDELTQMLAQMGVTEAAATTAPTTTMQTQWAVGDAPNEIVLNQLSPDLARRVVANVNNSHPFARTKTEKPFAKAKTLFGEMGLSRNAATDPTLATSEPSTTEPAGPFSLGDITQPNDASAASTQPIDVVVVLQPLSATTESATQPATAPTSLPTSYPSTSPTTELGISP